MISIHREPPSLQHEEIIVKREEAAYEQPVECNTANLVCTLEPELSQERRHAFIDRPEHGRSKTGKNAVVGELANRLDTPTIRRHL